MTNGFIKIYRSMLNWEWFEDTNTTQLFLYLLLKANHKEKDWRTTVIKRGELLTSVNKLKQATQQTVQQTRTSLQKLKLTGAITIHSTSQYSIISICNYDKYQNDNRSISKPINKPNNKALTNQLTSKVTNQLTDHATTTKEEKNKRKEEIKNNKKTSKKKFLLDSDFSKKLQNKILEFVEYREDIKQPLRSQKSIDLLQLEIKKKEENVAIQELDQSILNGWKGVFPIRKDSAKNYNKSRIYEPRANQELDKDRLKF